MKKKIVSSVLLASLILLNSCSSTPASAPVDLPSSYSILNSGFEANVRAENFRDGWAMSSVTAMESELWTRNGIQANLTPGILVNTVYTGEQANSTEGYFSSNPLKAGALPVWITTALATHGMEGYVLTESNDYTSADRDVIKDKIISGGALTCFIRGDEDWRYSDYNGRTTYNYPDIQNIIQRDRIVTIVGWDDDFPASDFLHEASGNGAWLVQNTFGAYWGDDGYFWMSYDTPLFGVCDLNLSDEYSEVVSYESSVSCLASTGGSTTTANVFVHRGTLGAVGTYTSQPNETIKVEIYNGQLGDHLLCSMQQTFEYPGYHTIVLDEPVEVNSFTVVVRYPGGAPVEGASYQSTTDDSITRGYYASSQAGQSYIRINGQWVDLSSPDVRNMIDIISDGESQAGFGYLGLIGHHSAVPNNACIKVLFI